MAINLGLIIQWKDGSTGTVLQEAFRREPDQHAFFVNLLVKREGHSDIYGKLQCTGDAFEHLPGADDVVKSNAIGVKLAEWIAKNELKDGFSLRIQVDNGRVKLLPG